MEQVIDTLADAISRLTSYVIDLQERNAQPPPKLPATGQGVTMATMVLVRVAQETASTYDEVPELRDVILSSATELNVAAPKLTDCLTSLLTRDDRAAAWDDLLASLRDLAVKTSRLLMIVAGASVKRLIVFGDRITQTNKDLIDAVNTSNLQGVATATGQISQLVADAAQLTQLRVDEMNEEMGATNSNELAAVADEYNAANENIVERANDYLEAPQSLGANAPGLLQACERVKACVEKMLALCVLPPDFDIEALLLTPTRGSKATPAARTAADAERETASYVAAEAQLASDVSGKGDARVAIDCAATLLKLIDSNPAAPARAEIVALADRCADEIARCATGSSNAVELKARAAAIREAARALAATTPGSDAEKGALRALRKATSLGAASCERARALEQLGLVAAPRDVPAGLPDELAQLAASARAVAAGTLTALLAIPEEPERAADAVRRTSRTAGDTINAARKAAAACRKAGLEEGGLREPAQRVQLAVSELNSRIDAALQGHDEDLAMLEIVVPGLSLRVAMAAEELLSAACAPRRAAAGEEIALFAARGVDQSFAAGLARADAVLKRSSTVDQRQRSQRASVAADSMDMYAQLAESLAAATPREEARGKLNTVAGRARAASMTLRRLSAQALAHPENAATLKELDEALLDSPVRAQEVRDAAAFEGEIADLRRAANMGLLLCHGTHMSFAAQSVVEAAVGVAQASVASCEAALRAPAPVDAPLAGITAAVAALHVAGAELVGECGASSRGATLQAGVARTEELSGALAVAVRNVPTARLAPVAAAATVLAAQLEQLIIDASNPVPRSAAARLRSAAEAVTDAVRRYGKASGTRQALASAKDLCVALREAIGTTDDAAEQTTLRSALERIEVSRAELETAVLANGPTDAAMAGLVAGVAALDVVRSTGHLADASANARAASLLMPQRQEAALLTALAGTADAARDYMVGVACNASDSPARRRALAQEVARTQKITSTINVAGPRQELDGLLQDLLAMTTSDDVPATKPHAMATVINDAVEATMAGREDAIERLEVAGRGLVKACAVEKKSATKSSVAKVAEAAVTHTNEVVAVMRELEQVLSRSDAQHLAEARTRLQRDAAEFARVAGTVASHADVTDDDRKHVATAAAALAAAGSEAVCVAATAEGARRLWAGRLAAADAAPWVGAAAEGACAAMGAADVLAHACAELGALVAHDQAALHKKACDGVLEAAGTLEKAALVVEESEPAVFAVAQRVGAASRAAVTEAGSPKHSGTASPQMFRALATASANAALAEAVAELGAAAGMSPKGRLAREQARVSVALSQVAGLEEKGRTPAILASTKDIAQRPAEAYNQSALYTAPPNVWHAVSVDLWDTEDLSAIANRAYPVVRVVNPRPQLWTAVESRAAGMWSAQISDPVAVAAREVARSVQRMIGQDWSDTIDFSAPGGEKKAVVGLDWSETLIFESAEANDETFASTTVLITAATAAAAESKDATIIAAVADSSARVNEAAAALRTALGVAKAAPRTGASKRNLLAAAGDFANAIRELNTVAGGARVATAVNVERAAIQARLLEIAGQATSDPNAEFATSAQVMLLAALSDLADACAGAVAGDAKNDLVVVGHKTAAAAFEKALATYEAELAKKDAAAAKALRTEAQAVLSAASNVVATEGAASVAASNTLVSSMDSLLNSERGKAAQAGAVATAAVQDELQASLVWQKAQKKDAIAADVLTSTQQVTELALFVLAVPAAQRSDAATREIATRLATAARESEQTARAATTRGGSSARVAAPARAVADAAQQLSQALTGVATGPTVHGASLRLVTAVRTLRGTQEGAGGAGGKRMTADQEISAAAREISDATAPYLANAATAKDDIVIQSSGLAQLLEALAQAALRNQRQEVITISQRINELAVGTTKMAREVATGCNDPVLAQQVMVAAQAARNFAVQLKIIAAVKAASHGSEGRTATEEQLVTCCQGVARSMAQTLRAMESARVRQAR